MRRKYDPAFADARGMSPGGIITYDPSKEGTGEKKDGVIKEISRSFLSLVLEDGTAIGATRVYTYRPIAATTSQQSASGQPQTKPWYIRSDEDDELPKRYASFPL